MQRRQPIRIEYHNAKTYPILIHCRIIPYLITWPETLLNPGHDSAPIAYLKTWRVSHPPPLQLISSHAFYYVPNISEKFTSQDNSSGVTSHQFHVRNPAILSFFQFNRTQRNMPLRNPLTDYINQSQNYQVVINKSIRLNDQTFKMKIKTTTVPTFSRHPLAQMNFAAFCH